MQLVRCGNADHQRRITAPPVSASQPASLKLVSTYSEKYILGETCEDEFLPCRHLGGNHRVFEHIFCISIGGSKKQEPTPSELSLRPLLSSPVRQDKDVQARMKSLDSLTTRSFRDISLHMLYFYNSSPPPFLTHTGGY